MRSRTLAIGLGLAAISAAVAWAAVRAPAGEAAPAVDAPSTAVPAETTEASVPGVPSSSSAATASAAADQRARSTSTEPAGVHVALDARLVVRFDRPVAPEGVTVAIEPPIDGKRSWPDPQTLVFSPPAWHDGKRHHILVEGPGIEPISFQFTTLSPPPGRIEPGGGGKITLTFDDGASQAAHVTRLLDLLEKEEIDAIFFPTGYWAESHPRLIHRMAQDGHRVCNHTYSHQNLRLPNLTDDDIRREIARGAGAGTCPLFRPPMRAYDARVERIVAEMGYTMYLWDVDSRDWEDLPAEDMVNRILKRARPGSVVLFHMHSAETLKALPLLIPRLRKAGYVFDDPEDAGAGGGPPR
jgi:peptidoglycan/xylan/chitin deacetylase (PgdA/CDA1 family)